ncbi:alpha/beta fold hydrolase [Salinifilum ghardaiensis]
MATTVVLVHGSFLGPWSWQDVVADLDARQVPSVTVDLPSAGGGLFQAPGDLHDDVAHVRAVLDQLSGPAVLCGHSYGGVVITEAAAGPHPAVRHLVYVAAAMPDVGESMADLSPTPAPSAAGEEVRWRTDGLVELTDESARNALLHDCSARRVRDACALLRPSNPEVGTQRVRAAAWRSVPTTVLRCAQDRLPELVSAQVPWQSVSTVVLPTGHCPNWSRPDLVAGAVADVVTASGDTSA